jgi:hypothetical protein
MESSAFEEFIRNRCEEVTESDEISKRMDNFISKTEENLKSNFSKEQFSLFLQYEKMVINQQEHISKLVYKQGFNDRCALK